MDSEEVTRVTKLHGHTAKNVGNNVLFLSVLTTGRQRALALPLQTSFAPGPDESLDEQQKKYQNRDKRPDRQAGECYRKRHKKYSFDVEDQKHYRVEIILRVKLDLRVADRLYPAFIGRRLVRAGLWRLKKSAPQPGQGQWRQRKHQRHANENDDEQIRVRIHRCIERSRDIQLLTLNTTWREFSTGIRFARND